MKENELAGHNQAKNEKMTLRGYYRNLPERCSPKYDFLKQVSEKCGVSLTTVRNWCIYGMKPSSFKNVEVLEELTGIPKEELWEN